MAKLIALHPVNHDGKEFAEGESFTVSDEAQVAQLVKAGAAVAKADAAKTAAPTKAP